jgi:hypothetical protein
MEHQENVWIMEYIHGIQGDSLGKKMNVADLPMSSPALSMSPKRSAVETQQRWEKHVVKILYSFKT